MTPTECPNPDLLCNECPDGLQCEPVHPFHLLQKGSQNIPKIFQKCRKPVPPGMSRSVAKSMGLI